MNRSLDGEQELIVVDNASSERPRAEAGGVEGRGPAASSSTSNIGFGAASNAGVAEAAGEATVLLNPDTELLDDGLDRLAADGARARRAGRARGCSTPTARSSPRPAAPRSAPGRGCGRWSRPRCSPTAIRARTEPYRLERPLDVTWLTGACVAGPTALLRRLGPFDPALHMFGEDVDLGLRAARRRRPLALRPDRVPDRPPRPGLVDARLRLARGLAADRHAELARGASAAPTGRAASARLAGAAASTCACGCSPRRCSAAPPTATGRPSRPSSRRGPVPELPPDASASRRITVRGYAADVARTAASGVRDSASCPVATLSEVIG